MEKIFSIQYLTEKFELKNMFCCHFHSSEKRNQKTQSNGLTDLVMGFHTTKSIFWKYFSLRNLFEIKHQRIFCLSIIQPSFFVIFVWDNNDINPKSLNGKVLHCTNGIIVQLLSKNIKKQPLELSNGEKPKRKRSLTSRLSDLDN